MRTGRANSVYCRWAEAQPARLCQVPFLLATVTLNSEIPVFNTFSVLGRLSAEHSCYMSLVYFFSTASDVLADGLTFGGLRKYATKSESSLFAQPIIQQKRPLRPLATFHVFPIRRTSVQSNFEELLEQSVRPIRFTGVPHLKSLFDFLPGKVNQLTVNLLRVSQLTIQFLDELSKQLSQCHPIGRTCHVSGLILLLLKCQFFTETSPEHTNF
jgi:hypothetical protein